MTSFQIVNQCVVSGTTWTGVSNGGDCFTYGPYTTQIPATTTLAFLLNMTLSVNSGWAIILRTIITIWLFICLPWCDLYWVSSVSVMQLLAELCPLQLQFFYQFGCSRHSRLFRCPSRHTARGPSLSLYILTFCCFFKAARRPFRKKKCLYR